MPSIVRERQFKAPLASVYQAIIDFESYPKFLPEVVEAKVQPNATSTVARVVFEIEVMKRFRYMLQFNMTPQSEVAWKLVESNFFKTNEGVWRLSEAGPNLTQVKYELTVDFGFLVPGWATKKLTETSLPKMFDSYEARAQSLGAISR